MKNLTIYRSPKGWVPELERLREEISVPGKIGYAWKESRNCDPFIEVGQNIMLVCEKQEKLLPTSVIQRELKLRAADLCKRLDVAKLTKRQLTELKDQVTAELYAKAFVTSKSINVWINTEHDLVCIETTSGAVADDVWARLFKHLGYTGTLLRFAYSVEAMLMRGLILNDDSSVDNFSLGRSCVLEDAEENIKKITYKNESLDTGVVRDYVLRGKRPVKLEIVLGADECFFTIDNKSVISKITLPDLTEDRSEFNTDDDYFDNEFTIRSGQCLKIINELIGTLGEQQQLNDQDKAA